MTQAIRPILTPMVPNSMGTGDSHILTDMKPESDFQAILEGDDLLTQVREFTDFEQSVADFIYARLGYPTIKVELTPFQIRTCIKEACSKLEYHAPRFATQYAVFDASAGCNYYELPNYIARNLSYVVYKKTLLTIQAAAGTLEFDFFIRYFQDNKIFSDFSVGEFYILQMHLEMIRKILSQEGAWEIVNGNQLLITPRPVVTPQEVILEYRALNSGTMHPFYKTWLSRYSLALAKEILGEVRSKYGTLPGPAGGASLNGSDLISRAKEEQKNLEEQLLSEIEEPPLMSIW